MKLSNYIRTYDIKTDSKILFNTIDKSVVELEKQYFNNADGLVDNIPNDIYMALKDMGYFLSDLEAQQIIKNCLEKDDKLIISVETTLGCNLRCPYCYQGLTKSAIQLSDENISLLINYFELIFKKKPYSELVLKILGGEPTIVWKKTLSIIEKAYDFCKKNNIVFHLMLDTNGVIIDDILSLTKYDSLLLTIPLTHKYCHDKMRKTANNQGTYDKIVENIKKIHQTNPDITIVLRHNTDNDNIILFEEYIQDLNEKLDFIPLIDISYTTEIGENEFINSLSYKEYKLWKVDKATDILVNHGFFVMASPLMSMDRCQYRSKYSLKIFHDGTVGPCAMWFFKKDKYYISDIIEDLSIVENFAEKVDVETEKCVNCHSYFICNTSYTLPCIKSLKEMECEEDGEFNINLESFIKKYMFYNDLGKGDLFVGFTQAIPIR